MSNAYFEEKYSEYRTYYLQAKLPGEFMDLTETAEEYRLVWRTRYGSIESITLPLIASLGVAQIAAMDLASEKGRAGTQQRAFVLESSAIKLMWPDMYVVYLRGGKDALREFFETNDSEPNKNNTSKHGKLKERVEQLAKRDGCQEGKTVPSAKIQKWVRELKGESITTKESSVRTILQRLGYSKERKPE